MAWIFLTIGAVFMQTIRNALQSRLSESVNTLGVTLSRFLLAPPIALLYLYILYQVSPQRFPNFSTQFILYVCLASAFQIAATSFMVLLFKQKNFAIGAGLAKSEALVAAVIGTLFFGSLLSPIGWIGILIGAIAVFVLSNGTKIGSLNLKTLILGLSCGTCFALTSLFVREASHSLDLATLHAAGWVLLWVLTIQSVCLFVYIYLTKPNTLQQLRQEAKKTIYTSITSCLGSICWFTAMAMQHVAYVKTLGQVEVLTTLLIAHFVLKNKVQKHEIFGLILIACAAVLVMWA